MQQHIIIQAEIETRWLAKKNTTMTSYLGGRKRNWNYPSHPLNMFCLAFFLHFQRLRIFSINTQNAVNFQHKLTWNGSFCSRKLTSWAAEDVWQVMRFTLRQRDCWKRLTLICQKILQYNSDLPPYGSTISRRGGTCNRGNFSGKAGMATIRHSKTCYRIFVQRVVGLLKNIYETLMKPSWAILFYQNKRSVGQLILVVIWLTRLLVYFSATGLEKLSSLFDNNAEKPQGFFKNSFTKFDVNYK